MRGTVLPSLDRMVAALQEASKTTETVAREFKAADDAAARVLNGQNVQTAPAPSGTGRAPISRWVKGISLPSLGW
jgi:hypothetical protein